MTARHELDGSSRPVNIFIRPCRLQYLHKYTVFSKSLTTWHFQQSGRLFRMTARHELDGSSRPVNIFIRPCRLQYLHKYTVFFEVSHHLRFPTVGSTFSNDGSSRTRRVVTTRQHFQKVPRTCSEIATSCYFTSANTTTRLPLDGSSSPKSRPDSVRVYWTTLSFTRMIILSDHIFSFWFFFAPRWLDSVVLEISLWFLIKFIRVRAVFNWLSKVISELLWFCIT